MPIYVDAASMLTKALSDKDACIDSAGADYSPERGAHYRDA
jgi:hypothetical protein